MVWVGLVENLPVDYTGDSEEVGAIKLEDTVKNHVWNNRCEDESDYITSWAMELLYDVDFVELAKRKGAES